MDYGKFNDESLTESTGGRGRRTELDGLSISENGLNERAGGETGGDQAKNSPAAGLRLSRNLLGFDHQPRPGERGPAAASHTQAG